MKFLFVLGLFVATTSQASIVVYQGALPYPYHNTTFGYDADAGTAWIVIESGKNIPLDGGSYWQNDYKNVQVDGLTYDSSTNEIKYDGIACGRARLKAVMSASAYPFKNYKKCLFSKVPSVATESLQANPDAMQTITLNLQE